ncbi:hypothetical protein ES703_123362 [subsurface metagenome]
MNTSEAKELKLYEVTHRATGEKHFTVDHNAQDACSQAGWAIADCYVIEQKPLAKLDKHERAILFVKVPCQVCSYQYAECNKPDDAECPTRPQTPDLTEWLRQTSKAHLCPHAGQDLAKRDYHNRLKRVSLQQAINELSSTPSTSTLNAPEPHLHTPQTVL